MNPHKVGDIWYRYQDVWYSPYDPVTETHGPSYLQIREDIYYVVKLTPKGVWLSTSQVVHKDAEWHTTYKWQSLGANKKFANPTRQEALESLIARKKRQAAIHNETVLRAHRTVERAQYLLLKIGLVAPKINLEAHKQM